MKIDYEELQIAMGTHDPMGLGQHYLDTKTGALLLISDWVEDEARMFGDPSAIDDESIRLAWYLLWDDGAVALELSETEEHAMTQQADAYLKRFLVVPQVNSRDGYRDMASFTGTVTHPHLRERLAIALNGRSPFRRFKDALLRYPDERERWFVFSGQCWRKRIDDWLRDEGLLLND